LSCKVTLCDDFRNVVLEALMFFTRARDGSG